MMNKQEADEKCNEIARLLTEGMRTSEKIAEAYMLLAFFYSDWIRAMQDVVMKEIH